MQTSPRKFGSFTLLPGRELTPDGAPVALGQRALSILEALLEASGQVVTKAELMERAWPGVFVEEGNIAVQVAALRKELGPRPDGADWIVTVPRVGYRLAGLPQPVEAGATAAGSGQPALAVLPFANLSGDSTRDYFADGVVEDIITALSRFKSFSVIARNSSFAYKNRAVDVRQVAADLGVRYLLEGSVRHAGETVRVTVQLVDAETRAHRWAQSFDGELGQIFVFQDRITESVVGLVEPQIRKAEIERARRSWPENPAAYDHVLRAMPHFYRGDPQGYFTALDHLEQAIAIEPDYAVALAYASWSYARRGTMGLTPLAPDDAARCVDLARRAIQLGDEDPQVLAIAGHSLVAVGLMAVEGLAVVRRALAANPNNVTVLNQAGICNMLCGDLDESEACFRRAFQLSPGAPEAHESVAGVGFAHFFKRDFEEAVTWITRAMAMMVDWPPAYWMLTASYAHLDRMDEARATLAALLALVPHTSLAALQNLEPRFGARYPLMRDGLAKAGLG